MKDGKLMPEGASQAFVPLGGGRFRVGERPIERLFPPPKAGEPQELHIPMPAPARAVVFSRVTTSYSAAELKAFAGQYRSDELDTTYTITVTPEGGLTVLREKVEPVPLTGITLDIFFGQSLGSSVTFVRAPSGDVRGFTIATQTPRSLTFTRIKCRRRPGRRACPGVIDYRLWADQRITWECPSCGDNGVISNWQSTAWDRRQVRPVH